MSKRTDPPYRSGPSKMWVKSKNPLSAVAQTGREPAGQASATWDHLHGSSNRVNFPRAVQRQSKGRFMTDSAKIPELTSDELDRVSGGTTSLHKPMPKTAHDTHAASVVVLKPQPLPPIIIVTR